MKNRNVGKVHFTYKSNKQHQGVLVCESGEQDRWRACFMDCQMDGMAL